MIIMIFNIHREIHITHNLLSPMVIDKTVRFLDTK